MGLEEVKASRDRNAPKDGDQETNNLPCSVKSDGVDPLLFQQNKSSVIQTQWNWSTVTDVCSTAQNKTSTLAVRWFNKKT